MTQLILNDNALTALDLATLASCPVKFVYLSGNTLKKVTTATANYFTWDKLFLSNNGFTSESLNEFLSSADSKIRVTSEMKLDRNFLTNVDFISEFNIFQDVKRLDLSHNQIVNINSDNILTYNLLHLNLEENPYNPTNMVGINRIFPKLEYLNLRTSEPQYDIDTGIYGAENVLKNIELSSKSFGKPEQPALNLPRLLETIEITTSEDIYIDTNNFNNSNTLISMKLNAKNELHLFHDQQHNIPSLLELDLSHGSGSFDFSKIIDVFPNIKTLKLDNGSLLNLNVKNAINLRNLIFHNMKKLEWSDVQNIYSLEGLKFLEISQSYLSDFTLPSDKSSIQFLSLQGNEIKTFSSDISKELTILNLSDNPLNSFNSSLKVDTVLLNNCELSELPGIKANKIDITNNNIQLLSKHYDYSNLKYLRIDGNPLACDCRALEFKEWLIGNREKLADQIEIALDYDCGGKKLSQLDLEEICTTTTTTTNIPSSPNAPDPKTATSGTFTMNFSFLASLVLVMH